ncbi:MULTISPECIES: MFS transporter [unclassified Microbacterium]|uniref:MFS transporter n=1 Tax=unclassified Microbacterium TaxID=2609290 RepID=UPI0006906ED7|nr:MULTISPECIES: MFS transporter [unclassified Microbacterium]
MSASTSATAAPDYRGTPKLLIGIVLGVFTFWLFAGSLGTVAQEVLADINVDQTYITADQMNLAVSITALFSGLFIVLMGGVADRVGRVRIAIIGNIIGIVGSVLVVSAAGPVALPLMLGGRALQGFSAALVMPATMALVRTYWEGPGRQRAVSMWSIGSWGGSGLSAIVGGLLAEQNWRWIFIASIVVSLASTVLIWGTPESKAPTTGHRKFDVPGLVAFMVMTLALMIIITFGRQIGWTAPVTLALMAVVAVSAVAFILIERRNTDNPFIDLALFKNITFTGATLSNFILNMTIGLLLVSQQLFRAAEPNGLGSLQASLLTLGYAVSIIALIRVGEKMLRRFGPRKPMVWGTLVVALTAVLLMPTNLMLGQYEILAVIAYTLFGVGLAFYATPSTDAALSNLPASQAGSGAGIYKMASSLGAAIGAAISLTIFTSITEAGGVPWLRDLISFHGEQGNVAVREAAMVACGVNLIFLVIAIVSIVTTVPRGRKYNDEDDFSGESTVSAQKR